MVTATASIPLSVVELPWTPGTRYIPGPLVCPAFPSARTIPKTKSSHSALCCFGCWMEGKGPRNTPCRLTTSYSILCCPQCIPACGHTSASRERVTISSARPTHETLLLFQPVGRGPAVADMTTASYLEPRNGVRAAGNQLLPVWH